MWTNSELKVLFMGGSITFGASATKYENSWAYNIGNYLKQRMTGFNFKLYNAAIPGTGTGIGVFRLYEHVLKYKPDIVFIEFAVNDSGEAVKDENRVISSLDYIIRELVQSNAGVKIILLYSAMKSGNACVEIHEKVARQYNVPSINIQEHIKQLIESSRYTWDELFADDVHPNNMGHKVYYDYIVDIMEKDWEKYFGSNHILCSSLASYKFCLPRLAGFEGVKLNGNWEIRRMEDKYKHIDSMKVEKVLYSGVPGSTLEFGFFGSHIGLYHSLDRHCGICSIKIDDELSVKQDFYYDTDNEFVAFFWRYGLETGEHTIRIEVLEERNEKSMGNIIAVASFLIG